MVQRGANEMNASAPIHCMRGVCVPEPMRRDISFDPGTFRRLLDEPQHLRPMEMSSMFAGREDRRIIFRFATESAEIGPQRLGQYDSMSLAALSEQRDLSRFAVRLNMSPL